MANLLALLVALLLLCAEMALIGYQVKRRLASGGALTVLKTPTVLFIEQSDSFCSIIANHAPSALEDDAKLAEVGCMKDMSMQTTMLTINIIEQLEQVGLPHRIATTAGMSSNFTCVHAPFERGLVLRLVLGRFVRGLWWRAPRRRAGVGGVQGDLTLSRLWAG